MSTNNQAHLCDPAARHGTAVDARDDHAAVACRRLLLTLLFTDIVASTRLAQRLGDAEWHALLNQHRALVRAQLARLGGKEVDCCGDGFLAIFPGPGVAIHCAVAVCQALFALGIEIRAGIHAGECDFEEGRVSGIAVHVAARIVALARPGEVLVSDTVKDLVAGSSLPFADRGRRKLRGLSESGGCSPWEASCWRCR
jgi:class 3 adenylate cyclase